MALTFEVTTDPIVALIKNGDETVVFQPHHPDAEGFTPWASEADAQAWAEDYINDRAVAEEAARVAAAEAAAAPAEEPVEE